MTRGYTLFGVLPKASKAYYIGGGNIAIGVPTFFTKEINRIAKKMRYYLEQIDKEIQNGR